MPTSESIFGFLGSVEKATGAIRGAIEDQADAIITKSKAQIDKMLNESKATMERPGTDGQYLSPDQWEEHWNQNLGPDGKPLYAIGSDPDTVILKASRGNGVAHAKLRAYYDQRREEIRSGFSNTKDAYIRYNNIVSTDDAMTEIIARPDLSVAQKETELNPLFGKMQNLMVSPTDYQKWRDAKESIIVDGFLSAPGRAILNQVTSENEEASLKALDAAMAQATEFRVGTRKVPISQEVRDTYLNSFKTQISQRAGQAWTQRERTDSAMTEKFKNSVMLGKFQNLDELQSILDGVVRGDPIYAEYFKAGSGSAIAGTLQSQIATLKNARAFQASTDREKDILSQKTEYYRNQYLKAAGDPDRLKSIRDELAAGTSWAKDMDVTLRATLRDDIANELSASENAGYTKRSREEQTAVSTYYATKVGPAFDSIVGLQKLKTQLKLTDGAANPLAQYGSSAVQVLNFVDNRISELATAEAKLVASSAPNKITTAEFWSTISAKIMSGESQDKVEAWMSQYSLMPEFAEDHPKALEAVDKLYKGKLQKDPVVVDTIGKIEKFFGKNKEQADLAKKRFLISLSNGLGGEVMNSQKIGELYEGIVKPIVAQSMAELVAFSTGTRSDVESGRKYSQKFDLYGGLESAASWAETLGTKDVAKKYDALVGQAKDQLKSLLVGSGVQFGNDDQIDLVDDESGISFQFKGKIYIPYDAGNGKIGFANVVQNGTEGKPSITDSGVPTGRSYEQNIFDAQESKVKAAIDRNATQTIEGYSANAGKILTALKAQIGKDAKSEAITEWLGRSSIPKDLQIVAVTHAMMYDSKPRKEIEEYLQREGSPGAALDAARDAIKDYRRPAPPPQPKASEPRANTDPLKTTAYSVVSGDSLSKIADRFGVSVAEIMKASGITSTTIHPGQKLTIPQD